TSWNLVRDAGSAVGDAAVHSKVGTTLVRTLPRVKEMISMGAGLALARRGTKIAITAVRRNPVAAIAGAVALAGLGVAITVAKRRKEARENGTDTSTRPRRLVAKNVRGTSRTVETKTAPRAPRVRKPKVQPSTTSH
ncbi:MAG: hypothetical protein ABIW30_08000, partial [Arenimonas sp.]